jgi:hypothetical protein
VSVKMFGGMARLGSKDGTSGISTRGRGEQPSIVGLSSSASWHAPWFCARREKRGK